MIDKIPFINNNNHLSIIIANNIRQPPSYLKKYKITIIVNVIMGLLMNNNMSNCLCLTKFLKTPNNGVINKHNRFIYHYNSLYINS